MSEAPARDSAAITRRLEALASALRGGANPFLHGEIAVRETVRTIVSDSSMVTLDVRGQCLDCIAECLGKLPSLDIEPHLEVVEQVVA